MKSQRIRALLAAATLLICLVPVAAQAVVAYSQDFEGLGQLDPNALASDGWKVFGNVSSPTGTYLYGYGVYVAPNDGSGFCQIDINQGGIEQGFQQLSVYSDYNNGDHALGNIIESNVFQEQTVTAGDVGKTFKFTFDAKLGNLVGPSTAAAFIKTINPAAGYALTNFISLDMTATPATWAGYSISIPIDASLVGQLLQFGFLNTASLYVSSGVFYDNVVFAEDTLSDVPSGLAPGVSLRQNYPNPFNPSTRIEFSLAEAGDVELSVFDLAGRRIATLQQGSLAAGDHYVTWNGRTDAGLPVATGRYNYVLKTRAGESTRSMVLLK
jgi:hypothetical protein